MISECVGRMESWTEHFHFRYTIFWPLLPLFSRCALISLSRNYSSRAAAYIEKGERYEISTLSE